jgi:hypothetical protein
MKYTILPAAMLVLLAACSNTPPPTVDIPDPNFQALGPIDLEVAELRVTSDYVPPLEAPNVDHQFPVTLTQAATDWATERLNPVGRTGNAEFFIEDASVVETELETERGFPGLVNNEVEYQYDGRLAVRLLLRNGTAKGEVHAEVTRSQTILEDATINERTAAWYAMMDLMMVDLNRELESQIDQHLQNFMR